MENEIYAQILKKQKEVEQQIREEAEKLFGVELYINVRIDIHDIPINMMPDGSKKMTTDNREWLHYSKAFYKPSFYSKSRNFKIVFEDDEPVTSNEQPASSIQQPESSIQS